MSTLEVSSVDNYHELSLPDLKSESKPSFEGTITVFGIDSTASMRWRQHYGKGFLRNEEQPIYGVKKFLPEIAESSITAGCDTYLSYWAKKARFVPLEKSTCEATIWEDDGYPNPDDIRSFSNDDMIQRWGSIDWDSGSGGAGATCPMSFFWSLFPVLKEKKIKRVLIYFVTDGEFNKDFTVKRSDPFYKMATEQNKYEYGNVTLQFNSIFIKMLKTIFTVLGVDAYISIIGLIGESVPQLQTLQEVFGSNLTFHAIPQNKMGDMDHMKEVMEKAFTDLCGIQSSDKMIVTLEDTSTIEVDYFTNNHVQTFITTNPPKKVTVRGETFTLVPSKDSIPGIHFRASLINTVNELNTLFPLWVDGKEQGKFRAVLTNCNKLATSARNEILSTRKTIRNAERSHEEISPMMKYQVKYLEHVFEIFNRIYQSTTSSMKQYDDDVKHAHDQQDHERARFKAISSQRFHNVKRDRFLSKYVSANTLYEDRSIKKITETPTETGVEVNIQVKYTDVDKVFTYRDIVPNAFVESLEDCVFNAVLSYDWCGLSVRVLNARDGKILHAPSASLVEVHSAVNMSTSAMEDVQHTFQGQSRDLADNGFEALLGHPVNLVLPLDGPKELLKFQIRHYLKPQLGFLYGEDTRFWINKLVQVYVSTLRSIFGKTSFSSKDIVTITRLLGAYSTVCDMFKMSDRENKFPKFRTPEDRLTAIFMTGNTGKEFWPTLWEPVVDLLMVNKDHLIEPFQQMVLNELLTRCNAFSKDSSQKKIRDDFVRKIVLYLRKHNKIIDGKIQGKLVEVFDEVNYSDEQTVKFTNWVSNQLKTLSKALFFARHQNKITTEDFVITNADECESSFRELWTQEEKEHDLIPSNGTLLLNLLFLTFCPSNSERRQVSDVDRYVKSQLESDYYKWAANEGKKEAFEELCQSKYHTSKDVHPGFPETFPSSVTQSVRNLMTKASKEQIDEKTFITEMATVFQRKPEGRVYTNLKNLYEYCVIYFGKHRGLVEFEGNNLNIRDSLMIQNRCGFIECKHGKFLQYLGQNGLHQHIKENSTMDIWNNKKFNYWVSGFHMGLHRLLQDSYSEERFMRKVETQFAYHGQKLSHWVLPPNYDEFVKEARRYYRQNA